MITDAGEATTKKVGFVFSGGGAKGAVQVGMVRRVWDKGIRPDIVTGNSVGAINAFFAAQGKIDQMEAFWKSIRGNLDVYRTRFFSSILMFAGWQWGYPSLYSPGPAAKRLREIVKVRKLADFIAELRIGAVDLLTGDFVSVNQAHPLLDRFLLGSTAIPLVFTPVRIKKREDPELAGLYCDGCVRNLTPVSQAVGLGATELHIFLTGGKKLQSVDKSPKNWTTLAGRVVGINMHELMVDDIERVILASRAAFTVGHGDLFRQLGEAIPYQGPIPQVPGLEVFVYHTGDAVLQDMLDFDPQAIREAIDLGYMLADKPVTTDVLLREGFGSSKKGAPQGYYYVERPSNGGSIKMSYEAFVRGRQAKEGKIT